MQSSEHTVSPLPIFILSSQQSTQAADRTNPSLEISDSDDDKAVQPFQQSDGHRVRPGHDAAVAWRSRWVNTN